MHRNVYNYFYFFIFTFIFVMGVIISSSPSMAQALDEEFVTVSPQQSIEAIPAQDNAPSVIKRVRKAPSALAPIANQVEGPSAGEGENSAVSQAGGVQVQNVTVQAKSELDSESQVGLTSTTAALRQKRLKREQENESLLIEKLEEERLNAAVGRGEVISDIKMAPKAEAPVVENNVAPVVASVVASEGDHSPNVIISGNEFQSTEIAAVDSPEAVAPSTGSTSYTSNAKQSSWGLKPFAGMRWYSDRYSEFVPTNVFVLGVAIQGQFNEWFGVEGNITYAFDEFEYGHPANNRDVYDINANAVLGHKIGNTGLRPYVLAGLGLSYQDYNIDDAWVEDAGRNRGIQRSTTHLVGNLGAGLDFSISENMSVGARFDYQTFFDGDDGSDIDHFFGDTLDRYQGSLNAKFVF